MANFILSVVTSSSQTLQAGDYGFITENGGVIRSGIAIGTPDGADNVRIINEGTIYGSNGMDLKGQGTYVENVGSIRGINWGIYLSHAADDRTIQDVIYNSGSIAGMSEGADAISAHLGGVKITNTGLITTSGDDAIEINDIQTNGVQTNEIYNSGTIITTGTGYALNLDTGDINLITNSGEIGGGILLGSNNDVVDGATGLIRGAIQAGAGDDLIKSGIGDDLIEGGAGRDKMYGGAGNDTASYETSSAGVRVNLTANRGRDGDAQGDRLYDIENLIGSDHADALIADDIINQLEGGDGDDSLSGRGGNDLLFGDGGDDVLQGDAGDDILNGGVGRDTLWGGTGADIFEYLELADSGTAGADRDVIRDFEQGVDLIDLSAIGATSYSASGFTNTAGEVISFTYSGGTKTSVQYDHDGDGIADAAINIINAGLNMTADDFILG